MSKKILLETNRSRPCDDVCEAAAKCGASAIDGPRIKHILLLPLNYNPSAGMTGKGPAVPYETIKGMVTEIFSLTGGSAVAGTVQGSYQMVNGVRQDDDLLQVWIGVPENKIPGLWQMVAKFGAMLGQETMYLERTGGIMDLIPSSIPSSDPQTDSNRIAQIA